MRCAKADVHNDGYACGCKTSRFTRTRGGAPRSGRPTPMELRRTTSGHGGGRRRPPRRSIPSQAVDAFPQNVGVTVVF